MNYRDMKTLEGNGGEPREVFTDAVLAANTFVDPNHTRAPESSRKIKGDKPMTFIGVGDSLIIPKSR